MRQDGKGDFTTLSAAVAAAVANDSIAVGPGTYVEGTSVEIGIPLVLYSLEGARTTILEADGTYRILVLRNSAIEVHGFTMRNGFGSGICGSTCGGAALVWQGADAVIEDCVFDRNAAHSGGALYITNGAGLGTTAIVRSSVFTRGSSVVGSAAYVVLGARATFEECVFDSNSTSVASALSVYRSIVDIMGCLFTSNASEDWGGAVSYQSSIGTIERNTFAGNTSRGSFGRGTVFFDRSYNSFRRNIVAGETDGYAVGISELLTYNLTMDCNVFWENARGPINTDFGNELGPDDVEANPEFCNPDSGQFAVSNQSPASPRHSACGLLIGAFPADCEGQPDGAPRILAIDDIPDDDGRQVRIRWGRSAFDAHHSGIRITEYGIYRWQGTGMPAAPQLGGFRVALDGWDFVTSVPARGDDIYQYVAPTLCDEVRGDPCWSVFFVSAMTADPLTYFDSEPDSGFSVDNRPPGAPAGFVVSNAPGGGNQMSWESPAEEDLAGFRIYRSSEPDFAAGPDMLAHETTANVWIDEQHGAGVYYKVTAVDDAGNESEAVSPRSVAGPGPSTVPMQFGLSSAAPNPVMQTTRIGYAVPAGGGRLTLRVHDAAGRLVRSLVDREATPGNHHVLWDATGNDGRRLPAGIYFYSLKAPGFQRTRSVTVLE